MKCRAKKLIPTKRIQEILKEERGCQFNVLLTSQNPPGWAKDPESEWLARENPKTNWITIKPETVSHVTEQSSWVPLPSCSLSGLPFPIKSLALSARMSPQTIHFQVLDRSLLLGSGRDLSSTTQRVWDTLGERSNSQGTSECGAHGRGQSWRHNLEINRMWIL